MEEHKKNREVTKELKFFQSLLNTNFNEIVELAIKLEKSEVIFEQEDFIWAWVQGNWELLVESSVCDENEFLEVYYGGADIHPDSERVSFENKLATHNIGLHSKQGKTLIDKLSNKEVDLGGYVFSRFVSFDGKHFEDSPSFDHIIASNSADHLVCLEFKNIDFILCHISD